MPYLKQEDKDRLTLSYKPRGSPQNPGELNYLFTVIIDRYLLEHGLNYQHINDIVGALDGAKAEFYRKVAAPYEEEKIQNNGDVYHLAEYGRV